MGPCRDKRDGAEVAIHGGVGGAVSGDDDATGEPDAGTGGEDGFGCVGEVISLYPYVPRQHSQGERDGVYEALTNLVKARLEKAKSLNPKDRRKHIETQKED